MFFYNEFVQKIITNIEYCMKKMTQIAQTAQSRKDTSSQPLLLLLLQLIYFNSTGKFCLIVICWDIVFIVAPSKTLRIRF